MALQVHQYMSCACPVVHRESQRGQQQIIDLGVIGAMGLLQQLLGFSFSPLHR
ncbi:hypothetical protein D1872_331060 [compost metagenome]